MPRCGLTVVYGGAKHIVDEVLPATVPWSPAQHDFAIPRPRLSFRVGPSSRHFFFLPCCYSCKCLDAFAFRCPSDHPANPRNAFRPHNLPPRFQRDIVRGGRSRSRYVRLHKYHVCLPIPYSLAPGLRSADPQPSCGPPGHAPSRRIRCRCNPGPNFPSVRATARDKLGVPMNIGTDSYTASGAQEVAFEKRRKSMSRNASQGPPPAGLAPTRPQPAYKSPLQRVAVGIRISCVQDDAVATHMSEELDAGLACVAEGFPLSPSLSSLQPSTGSESTIRGFTNYSYKLLSTGGRRSSPTRTNATQDWDRCSGR